MQSQLDWLFFGLVRLAWFGLDSNALTRFGWSGLVGSHRIGLDYTELISDGRLALVFIGLAWSGWVRFGLVWLGWSGFMTAMCSRRSIWQGTFAIGDGSPTRESPCQTVTHTL